MKRELIRTTAFVRAARRHVKKNAASAHDLEDAFDPRLKTHKLKGSLDGTWACSAGYDLRILFEFVERDGEEANLLLTMGTHDEVY